MNEAKFREVLARIEQLEAKQRQHDEELSLLVDVREHRAMAARAVQIQNDAALVALPADERNVKLRAMPYEVSVFLRRLDPPTAIRVLHEAPEDLKPTWRSYLDHNTRCLYDATHVFEPTKYCRLYRSPLAVAAGWSWQPDRIELTKEGRDELLSLGGEQFYSEGRMPYGVDRGNYLALPQFGLGEAGAYLLSVEVYDFLVGMRPDLAELVASGYLVCEVLSDDENQSLLLEYLRTTPVAERRPLPLREAP